MAESVFSELLEHDGERDPREVLGDVARTYEAEAARSSEPQAGHLQTLAEYSRALQSAGSLVSYVTAAHCGDLATGPYIEAVTQHYDGPQAVMGTLAATRARRAGAVMRLVMPTTVVMKPNVPLHIFGNRPEATSVQNAYLADVATQKPSWLTLRVLQGGQEMPAALHNHVGLQIVGPHRDGLDEARVFVEAGGYREVTNADERAAYIDMVAELGAGALTPRNSAAYVQHAVPTVPYGV